MQKEIQCSSLHWFWFRYPLPRVFVKLNYYLYMLIEVLFDLNVIFSNFSLGIKNICIAFSNLIERCKIIYEHMERYTLIN